VRRGREWSSWSGLIRCAPARTVRPGSVAQIVDVIARARDHGTRVRPRGAGHSSTGLAATDDLVLDLGNWSGIEKVDQATGVATVRAGTRLDRLNAELREYGLALPNLGDIDQQTLAGAISTATHGSGLDVPGMSSQVIALELVLADGSVTHCSPDEHPRMFHAARAGLGAVGVITRIAMRCVPLFELHSREYPEPIEQVLDRYTEYARENRHFEFYWFPYGRKAIVKRHNPLLTGQPPRPMSGARRWFEYEVMENFVFGVVCRSARAVPVLTRPLTAACSNLLPNRTRSDVSYRVLTTPRRVRFVECEYGIPFDTLPSVLTELRRQVTLRRFPVLFPAEIRVAPADDVWLSPAYQRSTAFISVQQFSGAPHRDYFALFESIVGEVGGRPHFGKVHNLTLDELGRRYPKLAEFRAVRAELDPAGILRNEHLDELLGVA
jgi:FAD-linked oxidoreductase